MAQNWIGSATAEVKYFLYHLIQSIRLTGLQPIHNSCHIYRKKSKIHKSSCFSFFEIFICMDNQEKVIGTATLTK